MGLWEQLTLEDVVGRCVIQEDGCIRWRGAHDGKGYPHCLYEGKTRRVFRILYEEAHGAIRGEVLHHRCEHKWCVSPFHAEDITKSEHHAFKHPQPLRTHCPKGHELTPANTYVLKDKRRPNRYQRKCRICERERKATPEYLAYMRAYYYRRKADGGA